MARFLARVAAVLDRIYDFDSAITSIDRISIEGSGQIVHDISRETELAAAGFVGMGGGFWLVHQRNQHAGATRIAANVNVYDPEPAGTGLRLNGYEALSDEWIWYRTGFGKITVAGNFTDAFITVLGDVTGLMTAMNGGVATGPLVLAHWDSVSTSSVDGTSELLEPLQRPNWFPLIHLPNPATQSQISFISQVTGAADVLLTALIWKGKIGTYPPGFS